MAKKKVQEFVPTPQDKKDFEDFIKEYGGIDFSELHFRPGAVFTCDFGFTERYKVIDGKVVWGYPGIHRGVDRGSGSIDFKKKPNPIFVPFNVGSSGFADWGGRGYGTDVLLYHKAGFRVRICHMYPDDIQIKNSLMSGYALEAGTWIGPAGSCGMSTGDHTHVEIEAWGFNGEWLDVCPVLELVLYEKYGEKKTNTEFTDEEISKIYSSSEHAKDWNGLRVKEDFAKIRKDKRIVFLNKYKMVTKDTKRRLTTVYSSEYLFGM